MCRNFGAEGAQNTAGGSQAGGQQREEGHAEPAQGSGDKERRKQQLWEVEVALSHEIAMLEMLRDQQHQPQQAQHQAQQAQAPDSVMRMMHLKAALKEGQPFDMAEFMEAARSGQHIQYTERSAAGLAPQPPTPRSRDHIYRPTVSAMTPLFPLNSQQAPAQATAQGMMMPHSLVPDLRGAPTLSWVGKVPSSWEGSAPAGCRVACQPSPMFSPLDRYRAALGARNLKEGKEGRGDIAAPASTSTPSALSVSALEQHNVSTEEAINEQE